MKNLLLLILLFSFCSNSYAQTHPPFSSMDVFELEWVTSPQIAPDGKHIVYERRGMDIMKDKRQARLWLIQTDVFILSLVYTNQPSNETILELSPSTTKELLL